MHVPDGFINAPVSATAGLLSMGSLWVSTKASNKFLGDKFIAIAGMMSALIFVLQMINFPIGAGTSGHLLGGALAVIILGPSLGIICVSIVVIIQAFIFADGGLSALGINILNMSIVTGLIGWFVIDTWKKIFGDKNFSLILGSFVAGMISVVMSSVAFVVEYALGGTVSVAISSVFIAMVTSHFLIGIGEGVITAFILSLLLKVRSDLVFISINKEAKGKSVPLIGLLLFLSLGLLMIAPFASSSPDGLETIAQDFNFSNQESIALFLEDYSIHLISNSFISIILSGILGVSILVVFINLYLNLTRKKS